MRLAESVRCAREGARRATHPGQAELIGPLDVHQMKTQLLKRTEVKLPSAPVTSMNEGKLQVQCTVCGRNGHASKVCKFKYYSCRKCGTKGHLKSVCRNVTVDQWFVQCGTEASGDDGRNFICNIRSYRGNLCRRRC